MVASDPCDGGGPSDCSVVDVDVAVVVDVVVDVVAAVGIAAVERAVDEDYGKVAAVDTGKDRAIGVHHDWPLEEDSLHYYRLDEDEMDCAFAVVARIEDTADSGRMADVDDAVDNLSAAAAVVAAAVAVGDDDVAAAVAVVAHGDLRRWLEDSS